MLTATARLGRPAVSSTHHARLRAGVIRALRDCPELRVSRIDEDECGMTLTVAGEGLLRLELNQAAVPVEDPLSAREHEVLAATVEGLTNARIGVLLGVSDQTVKFHLANIFRKLGVTNRTGATRRALTMGLL